MPEQLMTVPSPEDGNAVIPAVEAVSGHTIEADPAQDLSPEPDSRQADYEAWKQDRNTEKEQRIADRRSQLEAVLAAVPNRPQLSPEALDQKIARQREQETLQAEQNRKIDRQLDNEELHGKIGKPGLGRLRHPFKNARILLTLGKRIRSGEYNPSMSQPNNDSANIFEIDELADARERRRTAKVEEERRLKIAAARGVNPDPFEDQQ